MMHGDRPPDKIYQLRRGAGAGDGGSHTRTAAATAAAPKLDVSDHVKLPPL
jgi:hypothetical protein